MDYNQLADAYARHRHVERTVLAQLVSAATADADVLEIGCGTGNYITAVRALVGGRCVGVDPSSAMLEKLEARDGRVEARLGSAEALPAEDATFDLAFSVDVIHHVRDTAAAFREAFRILHPGGTICTATESEWAIRNRLMATYFRGIVQVELRRYPPMSRLVGEMAAAGFTDLREEGFVESPYELCDAAPYREKAFSSLHYLEEADFTRGLWRLEEDLARGPVRGVARQSLLWGMRPTGPDPRA